MPLSAGATGSEDAPRAGASRGCNIRGQQDNLGATYVINLRVSGTSCRNGKRVVKTFHSCRRRAGGRDGRCRSRVLGYRCSERRLNVIPSQYDARVRCKKPGREVFHRYTQNT
ncbi:MAG TPA: hypothetical protein VGV10_02070 [Thermoleophilaceae bacterium]|nr:hypothetical protein [Thermoleophilaceae bacterium]